MLKNYFKKIALLLALGSLSILSCSKEDDAAKEPITQVGGEVSHSQVITVNLPGIELSENEYQGDLDGVAITLVKSADDKLLFLLPSTITLGNHILAIPNLNNVMVTYNVKETVLSGTAEVIMADFFVNLNIFSQSLDNSPEGVAMKNSLNTFNTYYASASAQEKTEMAMLYKANKVQFDTVFLTDFTGRQRFFSNALLSVNKHTAAVGLMAIGCLAITTAPVFGTVVALAGAYKAYKANEEAVDNIVATIGAKFGGLSGTLNRTLGATSSVLTLTDDHSTIVSFDVSQRKIMEKDRSNTSSLAQQYFKAFDLYNFYANKDNLGIERVNIEKGTNYGLVPFEKLPVTTAEEKTLVNLDLFKNIKLTVNDPNLILVAATLESDGQLNVKIKITENSSASVVESFIDYSYNDEFSTFSGKLPVKIVRSLVGTWALESFNNGILIGQYDTVVFGTQCPNIIGGAYTYLSEVIVFTEGTYSLQSSSKHVYYNKQIDKNCVVTEDKIDTQEIINDSDSGTYELKGNVLVSSNGTDFNENSLVFIAANKIKLGENVYVRQ